MSLQYQAVSWNRQKRIYDSVLAASVFGYLAIFTAMGVVTHPSATVETLFIRGLGTCAFLLLHLILSIGPLCRLNTRFLPLLYNRRHLGVTMFIIALAHATFALVQFHAFGDTNPFASLFRSNQRFGSLADFPFEVLGAAALLILFFMAATSHDFWLRQLTPAVWKRLHMGVYLAYALLVGHVALGVLQQETNPLFAMLVGFGIAWIVGVHLAAGRREKRLDRAVQQQGEFVHACSIDKIPQDRAQVVTIGNERVAIFRYGDNVSAISNVCRHQNGPLGDGRIIDGCVTCPWHGYQYLPDCGASPPPFTEKVATYRTRIIGDRVLVHPVPLPPGTRVQPSKVVS